MSDHDEPRNELEQKLLDAQEGRITSEALLDALLGSQVYMPVQEEKAAVLNIQRSARAQPLVLPDENGTMILILFSSPERSKEFVQEFPGFGGGLLTEFVWILERMGRDYGIALNPGQDIGFDMEPETINQLVDALANRPTH